jgi:hypothetical protein
MYCAAKKTGDGNSAERAIACGVDLCVAAGFPSPVNHRALIGRRGCGVFIG